LFKKLAEQIVLIVLLAGLTGCQTASPTKVTFPPRPITTSIVLPKALPVTIPIVPPQARPITTPIVLRYAPVPEHESTTRETVVMSSGAQEYTSEKTTASIASIRETGGELLWDMTVIQVDTVVKKGGQRKKVKLGDASRPYMRLLLWSDSKGEARDFDIDPASGVFENASTDFMTIKNYLGGFIKKMMPRLPEQPVRQGDILYTVNFGNLLKAAKHKIKHFEGGELFSRAAGLVMHEGRPHILSVYEGEILFGQGKLPAFGYELLDVKTGHRSYSLMSYEGELVKGQNVIHMSSRVESVSNLPRATAAPVARKRAATARDNDAERRLQIIKRLLDKGLISEDEAAQKRKSILQAL